LIIIDFAPLAHDYCHYYITLIIIDIDYYWHYWYYYYFHISHYFDIYYYYFHYTLFRLHFRHFIISHAFIDPLLFHYWLLLFSLLTLLPLLPLLDTLLLLIIYIFITPFDIDIDWYFAIDYWHYWWHYWLLTLFHWYFINIIFRWYFIISMPFHYFHYYYWYWYYYATLLIDIYY
jgi:hypothetical protein